MKHSDVTISIICHTAFAECKRALEVVLDTREGAHLILTANGNIEAAEYFQNLAANLDNIEAVVNLQNLGFIAPSNTAFDRCKTEFYVALNDDAVPPPDWLDKLKAPFSNPKVAVSGPGERWLDDRFVGYRWRGGTPMEPDFIEGSCMMVRVQALRDLGEPLFWKALRWGYCEDAEMCLRMRQHGLLIATADFTIQHKSGTTTRTVPHLHGDMRSNFLICEEKWRHYLKTRTFA